MSTERAGTTEADGADGADGASDGDRVVELLGVDIVVEEDFLTFPWRSGIVRAPIAFLAAYAVISLFSSVATLGSGATALGAVLFLAATGLLAYALYSLVELDDATRTDWLRIGAVLVVASLVFGYVRFSAADVGFGDQLAVVGIVTYNGHNILASTGLFPEVFAPVAEPVLGIPVVGRLLQGLFAVGTDHAAPLRHFLDVAGGETGAIGHLNLLTQQETAVPKPLYYAVPVVVLVGAGYEFARREWANAATDSPLEVTRFGIALGLGYVATLLLGTVVFTYQASSPFTQQLYTVMPDRYLTLVFGFVYPAILGSVGAAIVYVQREL